MKFERITSSDDEPDLKIFKLLENMETTTKLFIELVKDGTLWEVFSAVDNAYVINTAQILWNRCSSKMPFSVAKVPSPSEIADYLAMSKSNSLRTWMTPFSLGDVMNRYYALLQKFWIEYPMLDVIFWRHWQTPPNESNKNSSVVNVPLTEVWRQQAIDLWNQLLDQWIKFDAVIASPMNRTILWAKIIKVIMGNNCPMFIDWRIMERDKWVFSSQVKSKSKYERMLTFSFDLFPPHGENMSSILLKALHFLNDIIEFSYTFMGVHWRLPKIFIMTHQWALRVFTWIFNGVSDPEIILSKAFKQDRLAIWNNEWWWKYELPYDLICKIWNIDQNILNMKNEYPDINRLALLAIQLEHKLILEVERFSHKAWEILVKIIP